MTYALTTPFPDLPFQSRQSAEGGLLFVKNPYVAYILDDTSATRITDLDYPSFHDYSITSLTRSGTTVTATTSVANTLAQGNTVIIAGAVETEYNGTFTNIQWVSDTQFTYEIVGTPTTPATGTITMQGGKTTVPGIVYLDDYFFVQDAQTGDIYSCDSGGAYTSWNALGFITPVKEPSLPVYLTKSLNFVVSLKEWDMEFFQDAAVDARASPLLPTESAYIKMGCASAGSVVEFDGGIVFISKRDKNQRAREVHILVGLTPQKLSTPAVERILNNDDLATVYSMYLSTAGHHLYVLTLKTTGITLAYDFTSKVWSRFTTLTAQSAQTVGALTQVDGIATLTLAGHGFLDGDPVTIAGANEDEYNGTFSVTFVDENTVQFEVDSGADATATGTITAAGYDESYFPFVSYANYQNLDLVLHETNGYIYSLDDTIFQDDDVPINTIMRLSNWDGGSQHKKTVSNVRVVGDLIDSDVLIRYSDDDYQSWSTYRKQDKSLQASALRRLGNTISRAYEVRHVENTHFRASVIEQEAIKGAN